VNDRCPRCDRETCRASSWTTCQGEIQWCYAATAEERADCAAHAVDWRARALAAESALAKRDRDWCLAFAEAVGVHSNLRAPLAPEAVAECVQLALAKAREAAIRECETIARKSRDFQRASEKENTKRGDRRTAQKRGYAAGCLDYVIDEIRALLKRAGGT